MKKIILLALAVFVTMGIQAQDTKESKKSSKKNKTEELSAERQMEMLFQMFEIEDPETQTKFSSLYNEWQTARDAAMKTDAQTSKNDKIDYKKMTEAQAEAILAQHFDGQLKQAEVDKDYYMKFKEVLTTTQAARLIIQARNGVGGFMGMMMGGGRGGRGGGMGGFGGGMMMMGGMGGMMF